MWHALYSSWKTGICNISMFSEENFNSSVLLSDQSSPECLALIASCPFQQLVLFGHTDCSVPPLPSRWPPGDLCSYSSELLESSPCWHHLTPNFFRVSCLSWHATISVRLSWTLWHKGTNPVAFLFHVSSIRHLEKSAIFLTKYLVTGSLPCSLLCAHFTTELILVPNPVFAHVIDSFMNECEIHSKLPDKIQGGMVRLSAALFWTKYSLFPWQSLTMIMTRVKRRSHETGENTQSKSWKCESEFQCWQFLVLWTLIKKAFEFSFSEWPRSSKVKTAPGREAQC